MHPKSRSRSRKLPPKNRGNSSKTLKRNSSKTLKRNVRKTLKRNSSKTLKRNSRKSLKRNTRKTLKRNVRKTLKRNVRKTLKRNVRKSKRSRRVNRRRNMRGGMDPGPSPVAGMGGSPIMFSDVQISRIKDELNRGKLWTVGPSLLFPYIRELISEFPPSYMEVIHDFGSSVGLRTMRINHNSGVYTQTKEQTESQRKEVREIIDLVTKRWADVNSMTPVDQDGASQINAYLDDPSTWGIMPKPEEEGSKTAVVIHDINFNDFDDPVCVGIVGRTYPEVYLLDGKSDEGVALGVRDILPKIFNDVNGNDSVKGSYDMATSTTLSDKLKQSVKGSLKGGIDVYLICAPTSNIKGFLDDLDYNISNVILQGSWNPSMKLNGTAIPWGGPFVSFESMMPQGFKLKEDGGVELTFSKNEDAKHFMYFVLLGGALELGSNFRNAKKYLDLKASGGRYPPKSLNRWLMTEEHELILDYSNKDDLLLKSGPDEIDITKYRPSRSQLHVYAAPEDSRVPLEAESIRNYASLLTNAGLTGQKRDNEGILLKEKIENAEKKGVRPDNKRYPHPNNWDTSRFDAWVSHKSQDKSVPVVDALTGYAFIKAIGRSP